METSEIVAYVGAAAWVPQIITWIYKAVIRTKLRIIPDRLGEIGFTTLGHIFNVRMAFFAENRDLIIDGIDITIRHENGETHMFRWAGLNEQFSEITDASGNKQIISKDQTPIAIKVNTSSPLERFVRFQEPSFEEKNIKYTTELVAHHNYLKKSAHEDYVNKTLESKEFSALVDLRKESFWWKQGRYEVTVNPASPQSFKLEGATFAFELTALNIEALKKNQPLIETELSNVIQSKSETIPWQWANVIMLRR